MAVTASIKRSRRGGAALSALAVALLLHRSAVQGGKPSLAAIPTHHGINLDSLGLGERGGAAATRRRIGLGQRYPGRVPSRRDGAKEESTARDGAKEESAVGAPSVSTSYSLEPAEFNSPSDSRDEFLQIVPKKPPTPVSDKRQRQQEGLTPTAVTCMSLLALQFGVQPLLVRRFTPQTIVRSSVVLVQEVAKFAIAGAIYFSGTKKETRERDFEGWSARTWIALAGLPAFLYTIQNVAALMAYQNLEPLTFNVLNQTKILSAALSCYLVMDRRQSGMQVASLCILILSTLVIEQVLHPGAFSSLMTGAWSLKRVSGAFSSLGSMAAGSGRRVTHGIAPILAASLISGMAGALTQKNLQGSKSRRPRNAYLFSMEMNVASVILLVLPLLLRAEGRAILQSGTFFNNWTAATFIPVITNSIGGILVGLVTKHAGSVRKGFALIFGLLLSGILQAGGAGIRAHQIVGGLLAAASLWMHTVYPYKPAAAAMSGKGP